MNERPSGNRWKDPVDELEELFGRTEPQRSRTAGPEAETSASPRLVDRFPSLGRQRTLGEVLAEIGQRQGESSGEVSRGRGAAAPTRAESQALLLRFEVAGTLLAVPMSQVAEIGDRPPVSPIPGLPPFLPGVANVRGEIVLLVDLALYLRPSEANAARRSLLLKKSGGQPIAALMVDAVHGIAPYLRDEVRPPTSPTRHAFRRQELGVFEFDERIYSVVDLLRVLDSPELTSHLGARS